MPTYTGNRAKWIHSAHPTSSRLLDVTLLAIIIFLLLIYFHSYYQETVVRARQITLRTELAHIRLQLQVFKLQTGFYPKELAELKHANDISFKQPDGLIFKDRSRINAQKTQKDLIDPFGSRYEYYQGTVSSTTKGYENW